MPLLIDDRPDKSHFGSHNGYGMTKIPFESLEMV